MLQLLFREGIMEATDTVEEEDNRRNFTEDGYSSRIMAKLLELRKHGEFCDVVLRVEETDFRAHKVVLAASSPYFSAMFGGKMCEKFQQKVVLKGVDSNSLQLLLDFSYTGQITITERNVEDLLLAADLLGFTIAKEACAKFLEDQLDPTNCIGILHLSEKYSCKDLSVAAHSFLNKHFKTVAKSDEVLKLNAKQLKALLESDNLHIDSEFEILELIIKWVSQNSDNNRKWLSYLIPVVKFSFIPPKQLVEISKLSLIQGDIFVQDIIEEARICHCECAGTPMRNSCASWLYIFGGEKSFMKETRSIEYFDCEGMEWKGTIKMSCGRVACAVIVFENNLYVIGGCRQGEKLNTVQCYNSETTSWRNVSHLSKCRGDVKAAVLNGNIYVAGGSCSGQSTCSYVEKYCSQTNKWSPVFNMNHKRRRFALVKLNTSLYAIGGFDDSKGFLPSLEHYVLESNRWCEDASMFSNRGDLGAVELSDFIYAVGGVNERQGSLNSVERYDPKTDSWMVMASMKSCRGGHATAVYCGKIFALNGMSEYMSAVDSVECYDETSNTWNSVAGTNTARFSAAAVVYPYFISK